MLKESDKSKKQKVARIKNINIGAKF